MEPVLLWKGVQLLIQASQAGFTLVIKRIQAGCEILELFSHLHVFMPVAQGKGWKMILGSDVS
jgi:hypothetical protein